MADENQYMTPIPKDTSNTPSVDNTPTEPIQLKEIGAMDTGVTTSYANDVVEKPLNTIPSVGISDISKNIDLGTTKLGFNIFNINNVISKNKYDFIKKLPVTKEIINIADGRRNANKNQDSIIEDTIDTNLELYGSSNTSKLSDADKEKLRQQTLFQETQNKNNAEVKKLNDSINNKLTTPSSTIGLENIQDKLNTPLQRVGLSGKTGEEKIKELDAQRATLGEEEYIKQYRQIFEDLGIIEDAVKINEIIVKNTIASYATVSKISENELTSIYNKSGIGAVEATVANTLGVTTKKLNTIVGKKIDENNRYFKEKYGIDVDIENAQKYTSANANMESINGVFTKAGFTLLDNEKEIITTNVFPVKEIQKLETYQQDVVNDSIMQLNKSILNKLKGGALRSGDDKEYGGDYRARYQEIITSPEYKAQVASIIELSKDSRFYDGKYMNRGLFNDVITNLPETNDFAKILDTKQEELNILETKKGRGQTSILGVRSDFLRDVTVGAKVVGKGINDFIDKHPVLDSFFQPLWSKDGFTRKIFDNTSISKDGKDIKITYNLPSYINTPQRAEFVTNLLASAEESEDRQKLVSDTKDEGLQMKVGGGIGRFIMAFVDSPYNRTESKAINDWQKSTLHNDPLYMHSKSNLYTEMISDIGGEVIGRPSDILTLGLSFALGGAITKGFSAIAKAEKFSPVLASIAEMTINNPNSRAVRITSNIIYNGLSNVFDKTSIGFNTYFMTYSNASGLNPLTDIGFDMILGPLGYVIGLGKSSTKVADDIYRTIKNMPEGEDIKTYLTKFGMYNPDMVAKGYITDEMLSSPSKIVSANLRYYSEIATDPKVADIITNNAIEQTLKNGGEGVEEAKKTVLGRIQALHTDTYNMMVKSGMTDDKIIMEILRQEGGLKLERLRAYNFIKGEFDINKNGNPILSKIGEVFDKFKDITIKGDDVLKNQFLNLVESTKLQAIVNSYGIYNGGVERGQKTYSALFDTFKKQVIALGGGLSEKVETIAKNNIFDNAVDSLYKAYSEGTKVNTTKSIKIWSKLSKTDKENIHNGAIDYINKTKDWGFLKTLGFDDKEFTAAIDLQNAVLTKKGEETILNKLAGKMNVGNITLDVADYTTKIDNFLKSPGLFKSQDNYERFNILSTMLKGIDSGEMKLYALSEESRNIYRKISPFMSMVEYDKKSLMLHEFGNVAILDNIISSYKKQGTISQKELTSFLKSMIEGWGNRIVGSLASDTRQSLLGSIDEIEDLASFLKKKGIKETKNKEEIISQMFEKRFKDFVFGKKGDIGAKGKEYLLNDQLDRIVKQYIGASEEGTKYINGSLTSEGTVATAEVLSNKEATINSMIVAGQNIGQTNIVNAGIDIAGAARISAREDIIYQIGQNTTEEMGRMISSIHYNNVDIQNSIIQELGEKAAKKRIEATNIAKIRRGKAIEVFQLFYDGEKLLPEVEYKGQKIKLSTVLNNMDYKLTADDLITTMNHNLIKHLAIDDTEKFYAKVGDIYSDYSKTADLSNFDKTGIKYVTLVQDVFERILELSKDKKIAGDVISRLIVGMPQYIEGISKMDNVDDIVDMLSKKLLSLNYSKSSLSYKPIYEEVLKRLENVSDMEIIDVIGKESGNGFVLNKISKANKNFQLAKMDVLINNNLADGFKLSQEGFDELIYKATIGNTDDTIKLHLKDILKTHLGDQAAEMFDFITYNRYEDIVPDILAFLKKQEKVIKEQGIDYDTIVKEVSEFSNGLSEKAIQKEIDGIVFAANTLMPAGKTLEDVLGDTRNSQEILDRLDSDIFNNLETVINKKTETTLIPLDKVQQIQEEAENFKKGIKKIFASEAEGKQFMVEAEKIDLIGSILSDNPYKAKRFIANSGFAKDIFGAPGLKVYGIEDGYKLAGQVRLVDDIHYNKFLGGLTYFTSIFGNSQSLMNRDKVLNKIVFELRQSKFVTLGINSIEDSRLYKMMGELFPKEEYSGQVYLQTFLKKRKGGIQKLIKSGDISGNTLRDDYKTVFLAMRDNKQLSELFNDTKKGKYYEYIAGYFDAISKARRKLNVSYITKDNYDVFFNNGIFHTTDGTVNNALQSLEGMNGLWLGADVGTINDITEKITPFLGKKKHMPDIFKGKYGVERLLYNAFANPDTAYGIRGNTALRLKKAEGLTSVGMYGMMFNPITGWQLGTQQILQNIGHSLGQASHELGIINLDAMEGLSEIFRDIEKFDVISGQAALNLLQNPVDNGKNIFRQLTNGLNKGIMSTSAQGLADKFAQNMVEKNSLISTLIEYGYDKNSISMLFSALSDARKGAEQYAEYITFKELIFSNEDKIKYFVGKKLESNGIMGEEAINIVNNISKMKQSLGNVGDIMNSYYTKIGTFYQFSTMPEVATSLAASTGLGYTFMKFMNRASKKTAEYAMDWGYAIAKKDKQLMAKLALNLVSEAMYVGKTISYVERYAGPDNKIDPVTLFMNLYTPAIILNMLTMNGLSLLKNKFSDKMIDGPESGVTNLMTNLISTMGQRAGMGILYRTNIALSAGMTKSEVEKQKGPNGEQISGYYITYLVDEIMDKLTARGNRFKTIGGYIVEGDARADVVNNILGGFITKTSLDAKKAKNDIYNSIYGDKEATGITAQLAYGVVNMDTISHVLYERLAENGVYDILGGSVESLTKLDKLRANDIENNLISDLGTLDLSLDTDEAIADQYAIIDKSNKTFSTVIKNLLPYKPTENGIDYAAKLQVTPEQQIAIDKLNTEITSYVLGKKKKTTQLYDDFIKDKTQEYKSILGEKICYGVLLQGLVNTQKTVDKERIAHEKYSMNYSDIKQVTIDGKVVGGQSIRAGIMQEVGILSREYSNQLVANSRETITSLNKNIPVEIATEYAKLTLGDSLNPNMMLGVNQVLWNETVKEDGIQGVSSLYGFLTKKALNTVSKMPDTTEEEKTKKNKKVTQIIQQFKTNIDSDITPGAKFGIVQGFMENITTVSLALETMPENEKKDIQADIIHAAGVISKSTQVGDTTILNEVKVKHGIVDATGTKKSKVLKLGETAVKLNKFQKVANEASQLLHGQVPATIPHYTSNGITIQSIQVANTKVPDNEFVLFTPPPAPKKSSFELKVDNGTVKKMTGRKFTPKTIKKIKLKFK